MPSTAPCWCWRRRICAPLNMCSPRIFLIRWWRPSYAMTKAPALPPSASCAAAFSIFSAITSSFSPAFFFALEKAVKGVGNAVIPTFPAHCPHGLQHLRHKRPTFAFTGKSGYTLGFAQRIAHRRSQGETWGISDGALSLPSTRTARSRTSPGRVSERQTLPLLGLGRVCSRRTQKAFGTAMRSCASLFRRRRGPAGLRDLFRFCRSCGLYTLRSVLSECARRGVVSLPSACSVCC